jgi:hypothetical protein
MSAVKNRFPRDFKRMHDLRIDEYSTAKALKDKAERAELYKKFAAVAEKYLSLQNCKNADYAVFIAGSPSELMHEGDALKHCVGKMNYEQKTVREETLIFFVRNVLSPDTPFVTVEYSLLNRSVLQCYGEHNTSPDEKVLTFVNKVWLPKANRAVKKLLKAAAA